MTLEKTESLTVVALVHVLLLLPGLAIAQSAGQESVQALRAEIQRLQAAQAANIAETQRLGERLNALEASLGDAGDTTQSEAKMVSAQPVSAAALADVPKAPSPLQISSDFRLRYEGNSGDADAQDWGRGVLRARLRASYSVADWFTVGGQIATGDPDDPNSTDVTLSNFADDLQVSLDQAYARIDLGGLKLWGGKFPLPFSRTDLVWDGDVSPQGIGGIYRLPFDNGGSLRLSSLYFLVDQSVAGPDSRMFGGQIGFDVPLTEALGIELSAALYDYSLRSLAGADTGDLRSNLIGPDGRYVSDFNLIDVIGALMYDGIGNRWPIRLAGEYVTNQGARTSGDTGYSLDLSVGQASHRGDWRFSYGYSATEVDAVLAAFSHDNTTIATNYRQHILSVDYCLLNNMILNATLYHYRPYDAAFAGSNIPDDWLDRLRLNFLISF